MQRAKVFSNGRSQAIRLPKEFRFNTSEVFIRKEESTGDVILSTRDSEFNWAKFLREVRDLTDEERSEFVIDRHFVEAEPRADIS